jgi:hypothetical protein
VRTPTLLRRLFGGRRVGRPPVTCYLRENGPIGYELELFPDFSRERADAIVSSALSWAWKSDTREWTELTRISLPAFLADAPSGVRLVAIEGELPTALSHDVVAGWIRTFCRLQPSPLAAAIDVTPGRQMLFVQQHATEPVNRLLDDLGLDKGAAERKAYARLGPASLESIAERL